MKRQKRGNRAFVVSFVAVFVVLAVGTFSLVYMSSQVTVHHLPSKIPAYSALWAKYVPADFLQVGMENFTMTRAIDPTVPPNTSALKLISPDITVPTSQVTALLAVTMSVPNATVEVAFLNRALYESVNATLFEQVKYTNVTSGFRIYFVGDEVNGTVTFGWIAPIRQDSALAFAAGTTVQQYPVAEAALKQVLETTQGTYPSILTLANVNKQLYIMGGATNHLAIGFENFPGVVRTSNLTGTSVDYVSGGLRISNVVGFNSSVTAPSQYGYVKSVYKQYTGFTLYDSFVSVQVTHPATDLVAAIRQVE